MMSMGSGNIGNTGNEKEELKLQKFRELHGFRQQQPSRNRIMNDLGRFELRLRVISNSVKIQANKEFVRIGLLFLLLIFNFSLIAIPSLRYYPNRLYDSLYDTFYLSVIIFIPLSFFILIKYLTIFLIFIPFQIPNIIIISLILFVNYLMVVIYFKIQKFKLLYYHIENTNKILNQFGLTYIDRLPPNPPQQWSPQYSHHHIHNSNSNSNSNSNLDINQDSIDEKQNTNDNVQNVTKLNKEGLNIITKESMNKQIGDKVNDSKPQDSIPNNNDNEEQNKIVYTVQTPLDRARAVFAPKTLIKNQLKEEQILSQLNQNNNTSKGKNHYYKEMILNKRGYLDFDLKQLYKVLIRLKNLNILLNKE